VTLEEAVGVAGGFFLLTISARYEGDRRSSRTRNAHFALPDHPQFR
jgi:hypothetical protein